MKATVLMDPERPKMRKEEVIRFLEAAGMEFSELHPDIGIVVGGDGVFSYFGRIISIPLLFVGVRSNSATASKGYLSEVYVEDLAAALAAIKNGNCGFVEYKRLEVLLNGSKKGEVFTDVSLEKGGDSNALRYQVTVKGPGLTFTDSAISNGVAICTGAGSTGYFSYIDKLRLGDWLEPERYTMIGENEVGVCHIAPTYTARGGMPEHPLRYTVPWGSVLRIKLLRDADARLFGVNRSRAGVRITKNESVTIRASKSITRVIKLAPL